MAKNPAGKQHHEHVNPYAAHKDHPGTGGILGKKQQEREGGEKSNPQNYNVMDQKDRAYSQKSNPSIPDPLKDNPDYLLYGRVRFLKKEVDPARGFTRKEAETISPQLQDIVEQTEKHAQSQHVQVLDGSNRYYVFVSDKGIASLPHIMDGKKENRSKILKGFYGKTNNPNEIVGFKSLRYQ